MNFCSYLGTTCPLSCQGVSRVQPYDLTWLNQCVFLDVFWHNLTKEYIQSPLLLDYNWDVKFWKKQTENEVLGFYIYIIIQEKNRAQVFFFVVVVCVWWWFLFFHHSWQNTNQLLKIFLLVTFFFLQSSTKTLNFFFLVWFFCSSVVQWQQFIRDFYL